MKVSLAYGFVVLLWSTTPLAVKWSMSSLSFMSAVTLRLVVALAICVAAMAILRRPLVNNRKDWWAFLAGAVGFFPTMILVYWGAQHIPSGLVSVLFGFYPFMVGLFSLFLLNQNIFNFQRVIALVVAVVGLIIINGEQILRGGNALLGVFSVLLAVMLFGFNSVWLKSVGEKINVLNQVTGSLLIATPCFVVTWFFMDSEIPIEIDSVSFFGVGYLAIAGSVVGGIAFYYVVTHCSMASVGLITLITPVAALFLSLYFAGESLSSWTIIGCLAIVIALALYQGMLNWLIREDREQDLSQLKLSTGK